MIKKSWLWLILLMSFCKNDVWALTIQEQLTPNVNWEYKELFSPTNVPLPDSVAGLSAKVNGVYSPSVVKVNGKFYMFLGVSIGCQNGNVARDSIALASSDDAINWKFEKYIIEPDSRTCKIELSAWPTMVYQANDPSAKIDPTNPNRVLVFYTAVIWPPKNGVDEKGEIGLAIFDTNFNLISRDDLFWSDISNSTKYGYSRPDLEIKKNGTPILWVDSAAEIMSTPLTNLTKLVNPVVTKTGLVGADINLPVLDENSTTILYDGLAVVARTKPEGSEKWSEAWSVTKQTGSKWDSWYQGSPDLLLDRETCNVKLYFSGAEKDGNSNSYKSLSIGMAIPPATAKFDFPVCNKACGELTAPVLKSPINGETVVFNLKQPTINLNWESPSGEDIVSQTICVSSNQTSCDLMYKTVDPTVKGLPLQVKMVDDKVTWSVTVKNKCGATKDGYGLFRLSDVIAPTPTIESRAEADFNRDGKIDLIDFGIWKKEYLAGTKTLLDFGIWKKAYLGN